MPAARPFLDRRRRSSHAIFSPAKPGIYGISARPVTFAPNVTPVSFTATDDAEDDAVDPLASLVLAASDSSAGPNVKALSAKLFPTDILSSTPAPPTRKRCPPGKRRSQGYIPRPPNAFMLFRADFVKQRHVPGSVETNHVSLSKIIGECWRQLPLEEKRMWEVKAKQEKAAHKAIYPDYRFRPVHNKHKKKNLTNSDTNSNEGSKDDVSKANDRQSATVEDERRYEEVDQLLLEGKNGEELARAVANLDRARSRDLELSLGLSPGLDFEDEYELDADEYDPANGYHPDGSRSAPSKLTLMPTLHMPMPHPFATGMSEPGFAGQPSFNMPFSSSIGMNTDVRHLRRPSSVPLPNEWFTNPNPFGNSSSNFVNGGIAMPAVPPFMSRPASPRFNPNGQDQNQGGFTHPEQHQHHQEFVSPNSLHWQSQQAFHQQQRQSFSQFSPAQFAGFLSAPLQAQGQQPLQHQQGQGQGHSQAEGQGLFHPHPQQFTMMQTSPRSSLGHRRASSAGPFLRRSWTMPAPMSMQNFEFGMDMYAQMQMERDHSPLPDVDPAAAGLFADFSFGNPHTNSGGANSNTIGGGGAAHDLDQGQLNSIHSKHAHARSASASAPVAVDPTSVLVAPIDTSIPPLVHSHSQSLSRDSSSDASSQATSAGSWDLNGYHDVNANFDTHGLYAPDSTNGAQVYSPDPMQMYSMGGYGVGYDGVDPGASASAHSMGMGQQYQEQEGLHYTHASSLKPTEASFGHELHAHADGAYFEVA